MRYRSLMAFVALCVVAPLAAAIARVELEVREDFPSATKSVSEPIEASATLSTANGAAFGYANLETGVLRSSGTAPAGSGQYAYALSVIEDSVSFSAGATGTAFLDWHFDGTLASTSGGSSAGLLLNIDGITRGYLLIDGDCRVVFVTQCTVGSAIDSSGSFEFAIHGGETFIQLALVAYPLQGGQADFSSTANFYLRTPDGVTYDSASGSFLDAAVPLTTAVPEPETYALILAGLALLAARTRRSARRLRP